LSLCAWVESVSRRVNRPRRGMRGIKKGTHGPHLSSIPNSHATRGDGTRYCSRFPIVQRAVAQIDAAIATALARSVVVGERVRGTVGKVSNNCQREDRATKQDHAH